MSSFPICEMCLCVCADESAKQKIIIIIINVLSHQIALPVVLYIPYRSECSRATWFTVTGPTRTHVRTHKTIIIINRLDWILFAWCAAVNASNPYITFRQSRSAAPSTRTRQTNAEKKKKPKMPTSNARREIKLTKCDDDSNGNDSYLSVRIT